MRNNDRSQGSVIKISSEIAGQILNEPSKIRSLRSATAREVTQLESRNATKIARERSCISVNKECIAFCQTMEILKTYKMHE
ncbi:hypothetical protein PUN28_008536 [Cardiocondyla obscurior]|uniref:Uncharacterized protein n=1 Tax=Cardiocondyla obscurior TaxID=286306 RepID=A0AAW2FY53_9HYME